MSSECFSLPIISEIFSYLTSKTPCSYYTCQNLTLFPSTENFCQCLVNNYSNPVICQNYYNQPIPQNICEYICQNCSIKDCISCLAQELVTEIIYSSEHQCYVQGMCETSEQLSELISEAISENVYPITSEFILYLENWAHPPWRGTLHTSQFHFHAYNFYFSFFSLISLSTSL